jgi:hypothetical protein
MRIICISGKAQHGKDTVATMLKDKLVGDGFSVLITHNADLLKHICKMFFGWNGEKDEIGRQILQHVGTDIIRKQKPDFWVDFVCEVLSLFPDEWDYVLIPDCRFPNEIDKLTQNGFHTTHLRVVREDFKSPLTAEQQMHPSELALSDCTPDAYIHNSGSLTDLSKALSDWLAETNGHHQMSIEDL